MTSGDWLIGLVADDLVRVGEGDRRVPERDHARLDVELVERLEVGRHAGAAVAHRLPHREPLGRVARVEAELALGVVERLAALAQPALERRLDAAAVGRAVEAALAGLLGQLGGARRIVVPGHAPLGQRDAGLLEGRLVDDHRARVGAEADAVGLAVDLAAGDRLLGEAREVEVARRHRLVERQQHAAARVLEDVAVVHLHDVGRVAAGGLRREPGPVVVPAGALALDADPRVGRR